MFTTSIVFSSLLALAVGKPIARRNGHISSINTGVPVVVQGGSFDLSSSTVTKVSSSSSVISFDGFGGLASLHGFDNFYGSNNFCGVKNVIVEQNVVTCRVTEVNIVQKQLAILAEYAKQVILTQSCESESQVLIFSQWLGNLVNFGQNLRHVNGQIPTYDSHVASQIVNVVDVSGRINVAGFDFEGTSIGNHGVRVIGNNWVQEVSPSTVGFVWESAVLAAGHDSIPLGVQCTSQVCVAPVIKQVDIPVHKTVVETIHRNVEVPIHTTIVEIPHKTIAEHVPVHTTIVGSVHTAEPVIIHETVQSHETVNTHKTVNTHETIDKHESTEAQRSTEPNTSESATSTPVILKSEQTGEAGDISVSVPAETTASDAAAATTTDAAAAATTTDAADASATDAAADTASDAAAASTTPADAAAATPAAATDAIGVAVPAAGQAVGTRRRLPAVIARRGWSSRQRV